MAELIEMEQGKIYSISYGDNTQLIARFKKSDTTNYFFYDMLHYWNGYENFHKSNSYSVHTGVTELRRATLAEKHLLVRHEIEHDCI